MDVDHEADYKEMVKKIQEIDGVAKIFVNMKDVEKLPTSRNPDNTENETTDEDVGQVCKCFSSITQLLKNSRAQTNPHQTWIHVWHIGVSSWKLVIRMTLMQDLHTLDQWEQLHSCQPLFWIGAVH